MKLTKAIIAKILKTRQPARTVTVTGGEMTRTAISCACEVVGTGAIIIAIHPSLVPRMHNIFPQMPTGALHGRGASFEWHRTVYEYVYPDDDKGKRKEISLDLKVTACRHVPPKMAIVIPEDGGKAAIVEVTNGD